MQIQGWRLNDADYRGDIDRNWGHLSRGWWDYLHKTREGARYRPVAGQHRAPEDDTAPSAPWRAGAGRRCGADDRRIEEAVSALADLFSQPGDVGALRRTKPRW